MRPPPPPVPDSAALFLDVDGCLLPFAPEPDAVTVPPGLVERLQTLQHRLDGALALVSGRSLATLDRLFSPARFAAAGLHGGERRQAGEAVPAPARPPALQAIGLAARELVSRHPGALVEDKGAALALHWRQVPADSVDATAAALQTFARQALSALPGYRMQAGNRVVELRPAGEDKGSAIRAFLQSPPFAGRIPVFAGDDLTDEAGFDLVNARAGISVLVGGRGGSAARFHLPDPAAVHRWLGVPRILKEASR